MELVEATAEDLDAIVSRWYDLAKRMEEYSELNALTYSNVDEVPDDGFRAHLNSDDTTDYLIVHENEIIGFVTLSVGRHPSRTYAKYIRIVNIAIDEDSRGQGHGTAVVEHVKERARDHGCDHLKVSCEWQNEDARQFYRQTGFKQKQVDYAQPLE